MTASTMRQFMRLQSMSFTPSDSPSRSPETVAIEALQEYMRDINNFTKPYRYSISIALFMYLTHLINTLLCEHIIGPRLATTIAGSVASRFVDAVYK